MQIQQKITGNQGTVPFKKPLNYGNCQLFHEKRPIIPPENNGNITKNNGIFTHIMQSFMHGRTGFRGLEISGNSC